MILIDEIKQNDVVFTVYEKCCPTLQMQLDFMNGSLFSLIFNRYFAWHMLHAIELAH